MKIGDPGYALPFQVTVPDVSLCEPPHLRSATNSPSQRGLDDLGQHIALRCDARGVLVLWHPAKAKPELPISYHGIDPRDHFEDYLEHAAEAAADVLHAPASPGPVQASIRGAFVVGTIAFENGVVSITSRLGTSDGTGTRKRLARLEQLLPLLRPFFAQWLATQTALARIQCLEQTIELSDMPVIMLGGSSRIVYANASAERLLAAGDGLRRSGEHLACRCFSDTLRMQAAVEHFSAVSGRGEGLSPVLAVVRQGRRPLTITFAPAQPLEETCWDETSLVAYVFDPEQDLTGKIEPACLLYGLSHRETKLTCALVDGLSLGAAAQRLRLQEQTARSYLKQIFAKTDTKRQAELVQLMLKSAVRIACDRRVQAFI
jgi:DNA-binding CsgD family transcriptional regulator/PAS domain-containing protein